MILFAVAVYVVFTIYQLKNKVSIEQKITNMKLRFFTDISHELRTPLTLIAAPVEHILKEEEINDNVRTHLKTVQKNTSRMLRLINQILDFRKIQNKKMNMHVEEIPIAAFVTEVCENFVQVADEHNIDFSIIDRTDGITIWADKDKVEKIIFNILSNAFKFTSPGKSIRVSVTKTEKEVSIEIKDQGRGIPKDKLKNLFERFVSSGNSLESFQPGTGIGLSLSKELIDMHHATVNVESEPGEGTTFTVSFLTGTKHYDRKTVDFIVRDGQNPEDKQPSIPGITERKISSGGFGTGSDESDNVEIQEEENEWDDTLPTLLIIEDNEEVRAFLRMILHKKYHILEAGDGKTGLEIARKELPDFVVSDIMMPEMNGIEVTKELKSDINTSHIPIILLTAKSDMDSQLEGLKFGADDYITKPFSATHLEVRIDNILQQRIKWREAFIDHKSEASYSTGDPDTKQFPDITPPPPQINTYDQEFMEQIMVIMEKNMDNIDFKVDDLVSDMRMGRTVFFKKLKSITGLAPVEFIKEVRIKRAVQLIESGQYTISQITYMVGMNDPRYFSRCFKQKYDMTPSEYKDKFVKKGKSEDDDERF
jgi:CheY-like chemotaxis protein